jgi:hypothetical protein
MLSGFYRMVRNSNTKFSRIYFGINSVYLLTTSGKKKRKKKEKKEKKNLEFLCSSNPFEELVRR